jgi:murein L,D-transpeptidase YcbB/YkuD
MPRKRLSPPILSAVLAISLVVFAIPSARASAVAESLRAQMEKAATQLVNEEDAGDLALLMRFYQTRGGEPLWVSDAGASADAYKLAEILAAADLEGLDPDDYGSAAIQPLLATSIPDLLGQLEWRLSHGVIQYAADLSGGRLEPREVDPELFVYPRDLDKEALLARLADGESVEAALSGLAPRNEGYARLKAALADYRERARQGEPPLLPEGDTLDPGMRDARVPLLRARLVASSDMTPAQAAAGADDPQLYGAELEAAVKRFQARHGLDEDGRIGKNSRAALNTSAAERVQQILVNLERLRWIAGPRPERVIEVNLADYTLRIFEGEAEVFFSRVVVGAPFHRTPVFRRDMTYLVINPYWNVPPSIAGKELLPKIKKNPGYLAEHNYELLSGWSDSATLVDPFSVDWSKVSASRFPYKIRQTPGDGNALGRVKFMLPNEFNIYLHDTPSKNLFARAQRSFSHGCIRVARPLDLAAFLLEGQDDWVAETIEAAIATNQQRIVSLARPIAVQIDYHTAWVDADGTLQFRFDVYERDRTLAAALLGPRSTAEALPAR